MNLPSLPRTEKTFKSSIWPSVIRYKAFTAGQQSLMLQVADPNTPSDERASTLAQIFGACVDAGAPFSKLPVGLVEEIFIHMRSISIGEKMVIRYICNNPEAGEEPCKQELNLAIPLNKVTCFTPPDFQDTFDLPGGYHVKMRQPSFSDSEKLSGSEKIEEVVATFIDCLYDDDGQVWQFADPDEAGITPADAENRKRDKDNFIAWVGENLEGDVITAITTKFLNNLPHIQYKQDIVCPNCRKKHTIEFNSLNEIFI